MTDDLITRAENALEGVTDGPWEVRDGFVYPLSIRCSLGGIWEQDGRFIATARTLVPELVAALKAAQAENELMYGRGYQAGVRQERENQEARR